MTINRSMHDRQPFWHQPLTAPQARRLRIGDLLLNHWLLDRRGRPTQWRVTRQAREGFDLRVMLTAANGSSAFITEDNLAHWEAVPSTLRRLTKAQKTRKQLSGMEREIDVQA